MKLSLAWIFDHIDADWKKQDLDSLVTKFNETTAEIERVYRFQLDLSPFALGKIQKVSSQEVVLSVPEWKTEASLPVRDDIVKLSLPDYETHFFMVRREGKAIRWAECPDVRLDKAGYLSAFSVRDDKLSGGWKQRFEHEDIILEVDNKSITHRPDMWGHRGFAREIAAILNLPFVPKEEFLQEIPVVYGEKKISPTPTNPFTLENKAPQACHRFSGFYLKSLQNKPSPIFLASRLFKVGSRTINAIVDLTNYIMQDWSQPTHAFDADKVAKKHIILRLGKPGEKLTLLDGQEIELTEHDLVVTDPQKPLALAGVMGGLHDSITPKTTSVFFESAHFDATFIRRSALRHKVRTESSARFEKTLDPNQITEATMRFVKLAQDVGLSFEAAEEILCLGKQFEEPTIDVSHQFIQDRVGVSLSTDEIVQPLTQIGFSVTVSDGLYHITVPSFRGAKDVQLKEDIVEEVVRFYGFNRIEPSLPVFANEPADLSLVMKKRKIKNYFAHAAAMTEVYNYALYNEKILEMIGWQPGDEAVKVANPISEHYTRLVTSLVPHLLKNVADNYHEEEQLSFFELAKTWKQEGDTIVERPTLAGIIFHKRGDVDFYDYKADLENLFRSLKAPVRWGKLGGDRMPWYSEHQTAALFLEKQMLGFGGKVDRLVLHKLDTLPESEAFAFELDAQLLLSYQPPVCSMKPLPKFQETSFDLSFMIPLSLTVEQIEMRLRNADPLVRKVRLIDFFEKDAWVDHRAVAFRVIIGHEEKTFEKDEIEAVRQKTIKTVVDLGAELRG